MAGLTLRAKSATDAKDNQLIHSILLFGKVAYEFHGSAAVDAGQNPAVSVRLPDLRERTHRERREKVRDEGEGGQA